MELISPVLQVLIFPGLLFAAVAGLVTSWIDRKVTARVQMRVGPPLLQPFYDILKYLVKETSVPAGASRLLFFGAPLLSVAGPALASVILWRGLLFGDAFVGDLIVLLYLLTLPAAGAVLGALACRNPLAALGGSREMKLVLSYELPLVLAVFVPVLQMGTEPGLSLDRILAAPAAATLPSGILALLVAILCMQAKLTLVPFDMPEAETELTGGAYIEYSGPPLALFKLARAMMLFTMPTFLTAVFLGGFGSGGVLGSVLWLVKYVLLVVVVVLIRNTAPRIRIDQAVRFFWGPVTAAALAAVGLAILGY